jgi:transposase
MTIGHINIEETIKEMGIIPKYYGILVHDHWKPYLGYGFKHGICNAIIFESFNG